MARSKPWTGERGDGGMVVYGKHTIRDQWKEVGDVDEYQDVEDFEASSMYPFSSRAVGEYKIEEVLWDEDTETIVIVVDDGMVVDAIHGRED